MPQYVDPVHLRQVLTQYYSTSELRTLCFDLGIDYESLGGRGKADNARALVAHAQNHNRIDAIAAYVRQTRPFIQLKTLDTPPKPPETVSDSGSGVTINVQGDLVQGDQMKDSKVEIHKGDNITVGDISNSSGIAIGRGASAVVTINQMPPVDDSARQALETLIAELNAALEQIPQDRAEEAEAVAAMAQDLIEKAAAENPNKTILKISGEGLKQAAQNIADIMPTVLGIATKIAAILLS